MQQYLVRSSGIRLWHDEKLGQDGTDLLVADHTSHCFATHAHPEWVIACYVGGAQRFHLGGATAIADAGTLLLIPPDEPHRAVAAEGKGNWSHRAFYPSATTLGDVAGSMGKMQLITRKADLCLRDKALARKLAMLHRLIEAREADPLFRQQIFWRALSLVVGRLNPHVQIAAAPQHQTGIRRSLDYMHAHLGDADLDVRSLARIAGLSQSHFMRCFHAQTGTTPHMGLVQMRVAAARAHLAAGRPAAEVAAMCGFYDQSHLIRHFRRCLGVTPGAYAVETRNRKVFSAPVPARLKDI